MFKILFLSLLSFSCASKKVTPVVKTEPVHVVDFEPEANHEGNYSFQFEGTDRFYGLFLKQEEYEAGKKFINKLSTSRSQKIYFNYYTNGVDTCFKSLIIDEEEWESKSLQQDCSRFYIAWPKENKEIVHKRWDGYPKLNNLKVTKFVTKNPKFKKYKDLILTQSIQIDLPEAVVYFILGKPIDKQVYETEVVLSYPDLYITLRDKKVFSYSARENTEQ